MAGLILSNRKKNGGYRDPFAALARDFFSFEPVSGYAPTFNVTETADAYVAEADLPGVAEEDIEVTLDGRKLTISGKRESREVKEGDRVHVVERRFGSFARSFTLPEAIQGDGISAALDGGVLTVTVPKSPTVVPRKIPVASGK